MIVRTLSLYLIRSLVLVILPSLLLAQPSYTIFGTVRLPDGSAASRVTVTVRGQSGLIRQTMTDDMGRFEIGELPRGRYSLDATNPDRPNQVTDRAEVDTARGFQVRISVNLFFKQTSEERTDKPNPPVVSTKEASQKIPRAAQKAFEEGVKAGSDRKFDKAISALSKAIQIFPDYFQAFAERGHVELALGRNLEAAPDFDRALKIDPVYGPALQGAGICKFEQGNLAGAITDLESASSVEPNSGKTFMLLGLAYMSTNRPDAARSAFLRALSIDPKGSARARVHLANLAIKENQAQEAIAQLDAYLAEAPQAPDADKIRELRKQLADGGVKR